MTSVEIVDLIDEQESKGDYRRANGAPMVSDPNNPGKWLRYSRPSGYAKVLDNSFALNDWKVNKAMVGVAASPAMQAQLLSLKDGDREGFKALREKALDKGQANEAADTGTALHAMTARIEDTADAWEPPEQFYDDLTAYTNALCAYGLVSEHVEVHMCNDSFRAAGTADRIYRLCKPLQTPDGTWLQPGDLVLGDLKTGQKLDFSLPGYCVQMAIYADGVFYDVENNVRLPTPSICATWTILVHLPVGKARCKMVWCSIDVGLRGALLAHDVKQWDKAWKAGSMMGYDEHEIAIPEVTDQPVDLLPYVIERIRLVGANDAARAALQRRWPPGVPTPKQGLSKHNDIAAVLSVLDKVEAEFSISFTPLPGVNGMRAEDIRQYTKQLRTKEQ